MWQQYQQLKLNGVYYNKESLLQFSQQQLAIVTSEWEQFLFRFILEWLNDDDEVTVQTSGSTGEPKKIKIPKNVMVTSAQATNQFIGLLPEHHILLCLSTQFIAGKMMLVRAMVSQCNIISIQPSLNPLLHLDIANADIYFTALAPNQAATILAEAESKQQLAQIKNVIIGGGKVNSAIAEKLAFFENNIYETFGMTETASHIALKLLSQQNNDTYFTTLPGITVGNNEQQQLIIYAQKINHEPINTNDIVEIISPQQFIWKGRVDNVINSGGIKLFPESIESKLHAFIKNAFFIAALPDEVLGNKLILIIETDEVLDADNLLMQIKLLLNKHEIPKAIYTLPQFVRTANGKIKRKETLELLLNK